jgi:hypothetical protein
MKTRKRFALSLALALLNGAALAEWVEIERFEDGIRVFVDRTSLRRSGDTAQLEHLVRWSEPQRDEGLPVYLSTTVRTAYDCIGKLEKYLSSTSYAGAMGNGAEVVADDNEAQGWYSISESSMEDKLWKIACGLN